VPVVAPVTLTFALVLFGLYVPVPAQEKVGVGLPVAAELRFSVLPAQIGLFEVAEVIVGTVQKISST
jgi:hypothetical protein